MESVVEGLKVFMFFAAMYAALIIIAGGANVL